MAIRAHREASTMKWRFWLNVGLAVLNLGMAFVFPEAKALYLIWSGISLLGAWISAKAMSQLPK